jgi:hypothetical protein
VKEHTILFASPFVGVITIPIGFARVGRPRGYASGLLLYSRRTRQGIAKAADFPSAVAVQQRISLPSRIPETSSSWTAYRPFVHVGTTFFTIALIVSRPMRSCQRCPEAIFFESYQVPDLQVNKLSKLYCERCHYTNYRVEMKARKRNIDATAADRGFKVRRLHNNFLTRFGGRGKKQTSYIVNRRALHIYRSLARRD